MNKGLKPITSCDLLRFHLDYVELAERSSPVAAEVRAEGHVPTVIRRPHHLPMLYKPLPPLSNNINVPTTSAATVFKYFL